MSTQGMPPEYFSWAKDLLKNEARSAAKPYMSPSHAAQVEEEEAQREQEMHPVEKVVYGAVRFTEGFIGGMLRGR